ncbi:Reduced growth phenotype protein 1 [Heracleum sosnowskyi]|uniref:Reduced growth phenotype protein 1 n=1 Tax=Heracleum sosnowskyi TaxID=360622 RepID=A0AAD8IFP9_9APIA|nr:Reduced growth phenotype protein 1 [Heracleum sosnowskyi]
MSQSKPSRGFSIFGIGGRDGDSSKTSDPAVSPPVVKLETDREVYRPGDPVVITIEIENPVVNCSLLVETLRFEMRGIEKCDAQWFTTHKSLDSVKKRGEYIFMDSSVPSIVSNQIISSGATRTYVVRTLLPNIIPPSYRGATIRYLYYAKTILSGQYLMLENGQFPGESIRDIKKLEARIPVQLWVSQKTNGLLYEGRTDGIVPTSTIFLDVFWKEMTADTDWARANETYDGAEDGYESSRDEVSSVSSYNASKESLHKAFGSSLSLQSSATRSSNPYLEERASISSYMPLPRLSVAEVLYDSTGEVLSPQKSLATGSPVKRSKYSKSLTMDDESGTPSGPGADEPSASEGFVRGRSYNIRLDDQVLLRFSPKNSESIYYFSDMIGGTLTFFQEEGSRRCLELSVTLELSETINRRSVHQSRRHSPTITKVQSDHYEVVADLLQTSFLFSIPMDGPMSFSTRHVSVQWALRFEFFTTPKNIDWTRFEHPLLIEGRDKCEWVLPITVHAPPPTSTAHIQNQKSFSLEPLWIRT